MTLHFRRVFLALALAAALPTQSISQEETMTLSCVVTQRCDEAGVCQRESSLTTFETKPIRTGLHGEGTYALTYDGKVTEMTVYSVASLWMWDEGTDVIHTMQATGRDETLWVRRSMSLPMVAEIMFLNCGDEN